MADFLSEDWLAGVNDSLSHAGPAPVDADAVRVVLEFVDAPGVAPPRADLHPDERRRERVGRRPPGRRRPGASSFDDARSMVAGDFTSADALREGRVKVRGDLDAVVALVEWLKRAHPRAEG